MRFPKPLLPFDIISTFPTGGHCPDSLALSQGYHHYGQERSSHFKMHTAPKTYSEAGRVCESEGALLAHFDSFEDLQNVRGLMGKELKWT